jgi:hypothetical protein
MKRTSGAVYNHGTQTEYIALSRAARAVGIPAHEITDAVSQGRLPVVEVSGCKCIAVTDLFRFKDEGGESWKA